ncbi:hypothetical protein BU25DRAFT_67866 [Macroventuria anomochaeta]|uniref:Uncharacterized protein n=1 Tax=Macroventuria anomochaeta TaxID=301207 RepID=A0ACB6RYA6_9PLEO|nr:uncharacterized protein BU25DRAFT_67866 [Macroventuria anomochaeta]KAF2627021.1 hypothetical protein BU25DRAFT_67866 [Macroventuria anomochaeta]
MLNAASAAKITCIECLESDAVCTSVGSCLFVQSPLHQPRRSFCLGKAGPLISASGHPLASRTLQDLNHNHHRTQSTYCTPPTQLYLLLIYHLISQYGRGSCSPRHRQWVRSYPPTSNSCHPCRGGAVCIGIAHDVDEPHQPCDRAARAMDT